MILTGTAISSEQLDDARLVKSLLKNFNCIYPENELKMKYLCKSPYLYEPEGMDKIIQFGLANNLAIRGHTLYWFKSIPDWLSKYTRDESIKIIKDYIHYVAERYGNNFCAIDVINEAITEDARLRYCLMTELFGTKWIFELFKIAKEAFKDVPLFYCDFRIKNRVKWDLITRLLIDLKSENLVDGVSIQLQFNSMPLAPLNIIDYRISQYLEMGLKVHTPEILVWTSINTIISNICDLNFMHKQYTDIVGTSLNAGSECIGFWHPFESKSWYYNLAQRQKCWLIDINYTESTQWLKIKNMIETEERYGRPD